MRPSKKFVDTVIREFKRVFPAVRPVKFQVSFVPNLHYKKLKLKGSFNTELKDWSPAYLKGLIELCETSNLTVDDYGCTLVHELLHGYYKKVGGLHKDVEEHLCMSGDQRVWAAIRKRLSERTSLFGPIMPLAMAA